MNAIVKEFPGQEGTFYRTNLPEPVPGPGQVKIKVMAASICASDIHALYNGLMADRYRYPVIIGHEGAGVVVEVGEGVEDIRVGDRVTAETTLTSCGTCEYCRKGETNMCASRKGLGSAADGYFANYCIASAKYCHKLADDLSFEEGALAEPFACVVHAVCNLTHPMAGDLVLVVGPGPMGQMVAALAKASGCVVVISGKIVFSDPTSSSAAWNNLSNIFAVYGNDSDEAWDVIEGLLANGMVVAGSSSACFKNVQAGEYVVGLTYEDGASTLLKNGAENIKMVYPSEGSSAFAFAAAIVKGAPHMDAAKAMIDYLQSAEGQSFRANYVGTVRFTNEDVVVEDSYLPDSSSIKWVNRDIDWLIANKSAMLEKWTALYNQYNG